jgi:hypothetical protein
MDYVKFPKLIHNLWTVYEEDPDTYILRTSKGHFEVSKEEAELFLTFRGYCTGHKSQKEIAALTSIPEEKISSVIQSLAEIESIRHEGKLDALSPAAIRQKMITACEMWAEQLGDTHLFTEILAGKHRIEVLNGFLLETYHYIKHFPDLLAVARDHADNPVLKNVLNEYHSQECGHEAFVLSCLEKAGFGEHEVETSIPLVSTNTILLLMKDLFEQFPCTVLLVARVIEADAYSDESVEYIREALRTRLHIDSTTLDGLIKHMEVDYQLGHAELLNNHKDLIILPNKADAHFILNRIHDIKHAFDLQKLEIVDYYTHKGNYVPRQKVDFFAV